MRKRGGKGFVIKFSGQEVIKRGGLLTSNLEGIGLADTPPFCLGLEGEDTPCFGKGPLDRHTFFS
jgi:hypothetical protein